MWFHHKTQICRDYDFLAYIERFFYHTVVYFCLFSSCFIRLSWKYHQKLKIKSLKKISAPDSYLATDRRRIDAYDVVMMSFWYIYIILSFIVVERWFFHLDICFRGRPSQWSCRNLEILTFRRRFAPFSVAGRTFSGPPSAKTVGSRLKWIAKSDSSSQKYPE